MSWQRARWVVLGAVIVALIWTVRGSVARLQQARVSGAVCGALERQDPAAAVEGSAHLAGLDVGVKDRGLLEAIECRCLALVASGDGGSCVREIADWTNRESLSTWVPQPVLAAAAIDELEQVGRFQRAVELAQLAASAYPSSTLFHSREFRVRSNRNLANPGEARSDPMAELLVEFEARAQRLGDQSADLPLLLADRYAERSQWSDALRVLGDQPPGDAAVQKEWFTLLTRAIAGLGDPGALRRAFDRWESALGGSAELTAHRALQFSRSNLLPTLEIGIAQLSAALRVESAVPDQMLRVAVRSRLIRSLVIAERFEEALALFDDTQAQYGLELTISRSEIERAALGEFSDEGPSASGLASAPRVAIEFTGLEVGDRLVLPPSDWTDPSAPFVELSRAQALGLRRPGSGPPQWWAVLDQQGLVVAEGSLPLARAPVRVDVNRREPESKAAWRMPAAGPADGRGRVLQLILDSADWRILQFMVASGRMPALEGLMATGASGSLLSEPAYTAAALQSLIQPGEASFGVLQLVYELGGEIEALNFVGRNPVSGLEMVIPQRPGLFETVGAGSLSAVNLLRSTGSLRAGRNATISGPRGGVSRLSSNVGSRELSLAEVASLPQLGRELGNFRVHFEEAAGDFDTVQSVLAANQIDFISARVAALDLITHSAFGELTEMGQFDATPLLLVYYQYLDFRIAQLGDELDEDDTLIVMSDHGARSSLEHDPVAVLVMTGPRVRSGLLEGRPALAGVSRLVAEVLSVETEWPDTDLLRLLEPN